MPTNFPTSVDNFTNPTANDSLNLPSHSTQHANANDAIEAVESYLLNGGGKNGLVHINTTTFTAMSNQTVTNLFSSAYDNYRVVIVGQGSVGQDLFLRLATGTTVESTASSYHYQSLKCNGATISGASTTSQSRWEVTAYDTVTTGMQFEVYNPNLVAPTAFYATGGRYDQLWTFTGKQTSAAAYDGLNFFTGSGTFTGIARVYGYRNS
jgi:hypothetical protein